MSANIEYNARQPWPLLKIKRSLFSHFGFDASKVKNESNNTLIISIRDNAGPICPLLSTSTILITFFLKSFERSSNLVIFLINFFF